MKPIGKVIRRIRKEKDLTLEHVAAQIDGYDAGNLSKFERGLQGIDGKTLEELAGAIGAPLSLIYAEAEIMGRVADDPAEYVPARLLVDVSRVPSPDLKRQIMELVSKVADGRISRDKFDAVLKILLSH